MYQTREFCTGQHALMNALSALIVFPIYMCYAYSLLHKKVQTLFTRLFLGALLCLLGVTTLLITDLVGHSLKTISNHSQCMFQFYTVNGTLQYPALDMHWSVLFPPSLLLGVGPLIVMTATLEFISAQSPQSMKGFSLDSSLPSDVSFSS